MHFSGSCDGACHNFSSNIIMHFSWSITVVICALAVVSWGYSACAMCTRSIFIGTIPIVLYLCYYSHLLAFPEFRQIQSLLCCPWTIGREKVLFVFQTDPVLLLSMLSITLMALFRHTCLPLSAHINHRTFFNRKTAQNSKNKPENVWWRFFWLRCSDCLELADLRASPCLPNFKVNLKTHFFRQAFWLICTC